MHIVAEAFVKLAAARFGDFEVANGFKDAIGHIVRVEKGEKPLVRRRKKQGAARFKHSMNLAQRGAVIAGVLQNLGAHDRLEKTVIKGQTLALGFYEIDVWKLLACPFEVAVVVVNAIG